MVESTVRESPSRRPRRRRQGIRRSVLTVLGLPVVLLLAVGVLCAQTIGTVTGTVKDRDTSETLAGTTVLVVETRVSARTDADGTYTLRVPAGTYTLLVARSGYETLERQIAVSVGKTSTFNLDLTPTLAKFGENIVVLGSRTARTVLETPVPVDVLDSGELEASGQSETARAIQYLAPSFNFSTSTISDGTDIVRPSTLRGLGPDQTLILVNGKRRHNSALVHVNGSVGRGTSGVDLNAIPSSALGSIEILRDGAAAQYGSDAIAGVINVTLKEQTEKTEVDVSGGRMYAGDGEVAQVSVNHGWKIRDSGFFNVTGEFRDRRHTNRAGLDPRNQYDDSGGLDPRELTFDRLNHRYGDADSENAYVFFNSSVPISDDWTFYSFGGMSRRDGESAGFYRRAVDDRTVPSIHPDGFLPMINTDVDDMSVSAGVRKLFSDWVLDASLTYGSNEFEFTITNSNNVSLGPNSPTSAQAGTLNFGQATFNVDFFGTMDWGNIPVNVATGIEFRQDMYEIEAGEEASWCGGDPAETDPSIVCSDPYFPAQSGGDAALGIQVFPGFRPGNEVDEDRENFAAYGDVELNIGEDLLVGFAGRFEDYSDFGNNFSGKIAARYSITDRFAVRGSGSTGFRAPSLHQSFFNNTSTQFDGAGNPFEVVTFKNDDQAVKDFGVPELEEETSVGGSIGFTAQPMKGLSITADVFRIDIDDRIVISGEFEPEDIATCIAPGDCPIREVLDPLGVGKAQFWANAIDTETTGADLVISYSRALGGNRALSVTGAANWNRTEVVGEVDAPAPLADARDTLFNRTERERIETAQPRHLENLAFNYRQGAFSALVRFNRFGEVKVADTASDPSLDQVFGAKIITDLDLSYRYRNGIRFAVGANNLFDVFPDKNSAPLSFNGIFVYNRRTAPFGFNGGYFYTKVSFDF